jgi:predicted ArsR family transcriptional regulator
MHLSFRFWTGLGKDSRMSEEFATQVAGVGALAEPARRALYLYVAAEPDLVSREQAAEACGLPLHSVKFHLDRLVDEGLLEVEFRRLSGRSGPGAGRPSKLYRRSDRQVTVSLPERRYDLAGEVLAAAIDRSLTEDVSVREAVATAAEAEGRRIAASGGGEGSDLERTTDVLAGHGYEPRTSDGEICLANCPFDSLAREHTELVCGMNLSLVTGLLDELGCHSLEAVLDPEPGLCCVKAKARD